MKSNIELIEKDKWRDFVWNHPDGNVFQTPEMYDLYCLAKQYAPFILFSFNSNNEISGLISAVIQKETSGFIGNFTARSIIVGGPLVKDNQDYIANDLLKEYKKFIRGRAIYTQFRNIFDTNYLKESFSSAGFVYEDHLDILIDLNKSITDLELDIHKERKRNIARAVNKEVQFKEITDEENIKNSVELIKKTYQRIKLPVPPLVIIQEANKILGNKVKYFGAFYDDKLISSRIVLCYKSLVYDWYAGTDIDFLNKYPNDFLPWKIILWAKGNGYATFDFGGAGKPNVPYGVRDYKLKFGGTLISPGRYNLVHEELLYATGKLGIKILKWL